MKKNDDIEILFSNIIMCLMSQEISKKEILFYKGIGNEHNFADVITDIDINGRFDFSKNICAINFPYHQMDTKSIQILLDSDHITNNKFIIFINKHDILSGNWSKIKDFSKEISEKKERKIYLACDLSWIDIDNLSRFFSAISYYENIIPVVTSFSEESISKDKIFNIANRCSLESTLPVCYYGPLPNDPENLSYLLENGFNKLIIQAKSATKLVTTI